MTTTTKQLLASLLIGFWGGFCVARLREVAPEERWLSPWLPALITCALLFIVVWIPE